MVYKQQPPIGTKTSSDICLRIFLQTHGTFIAHDQNVLMDYKIKQTFLSHTRLI